MEAGSQADKHYMKIVSYNQSGQKKGYGLACVNTTSEDNGCSGDLQQQTNEMMKKAYLRHFSVIKKECIPKALRLVTDFIWRHVQCDAIVFEYFLVKN